MSLFKRNKKEKEAVESQSPGNSPPVSTAPAMGANGRGPQGQAPYNNMNGGPQGANGRRMTSNPTSILNHPHPSTMPASQSQGMHPNASQIALPHDPQPTSAPGRPTSAASTANYPWSTRPLRLYAPQTSPPAAPISPFPRYGLAVPASPSHSGHMLIFGGLVHDSVRNDLWSMDVRDCTTMLVKTKGDAPIPRVGHAAVMADRIMIMFGGDTKIRQEDQQDDGLYILDLRTQEWTRLPVQTGPIGRYGHAVCMANSRFFVFAGQGEGEFLNDLWSYDIRQLSGSDHRWERIQYASPAPARRTGHTLVAYQSKLYLFGGTDGQYHYNDTWSLDLATNVWTELSCIGYIPVPREGHAAVLVDDVFYVFGGRDVNGNDLGDLAAFRMTNHRWYMFQNMGPAPTPRSGHAMVAAHGKVFVVGGEANSASANAKDDPSLLHVLDTTKIKYPPDTQPPRQLRNKTSEQLLRDGTPPRPAHPADSPQLKKVGMTGSASIDSLARAASPPVASQPPALAPPVQTLNTQPAAPVGIENMNGPIRAPNGPPQRPKREGDDEFRRAMSPTNGGPSSPSQAGYRVTSPSANGPSSPPGQGKIGFNAAALGARSPSPRLRNIDLNISNGSSDRQAPPPDAFYYGRSPTANNLSPRPSSTGTAAELLKELKAKDAEVDAGKKREAALRVIIGQSAGRDFSSEDAVDLPNGEGDEGVIRKLADALIRLKEEKAALQSDIALQVRAATDRAVESERLRRGALQEAAFYRAKIATFESGSPLDGRMEKERIVELERHVAQLVADRTASLKQLEKLQNEADHHRQSHMAASDREGQSSRQAEELEEAHRQSLEECESLQTRVRTAEASVREHTERLITLSSTAQQREAERDQLQREVEDATRAKDEHVGLVEQAQLAITAAGQRARELEGMHEQSQKRAGALEVELADLRAELEARTRDAEQATSRLADVENAYSQSRQEADSLRTLTTSRLGELLDSHKELKEEAAQGSRAHQDQLRALQEEGVSLRKMLREAGQRVDAAEAGVTHHRQRARDLETTHHGLRGEIRTHQKKLTAAQQELDKWRDLHSTREEELRDRETKVLEVETRCALLRNLLAEHGIAINDEDTNADHPAAGQGDLEKQLRERVRAHEDSQREVEELTRRCQEAEDKVESLGRLVERIKDARSPTGLSMRSPSPAADPDRRVAEAEKKMQEMESQHKDKLAALESDYQTAVRYVKGTEKMLKRMKDEVNKQKATNISLQSELDRSRGRSSVEPGQPRSVSGRHTPMSPNPDPELSRKLDKLQAQHNALQAELSAARDVQTAREREVEALRMRCGEYEREVEALREELLQAQHRISTLLEMGKTGFLGSDDEGLEERGSGEGSDEGASMAFHQLTDELKQWERARSPQVNGHATRQHNEAASRSPAQAAVASAGHRRHSSEYSGDWTQ